MGEAGEDESTTRRACVSLAQNKLAVDDANVADLAACHRLNAKAGSAIIASQIGVARMPTQGSCRP